ncbi:MAG: hypothetical protein NVS3B25_25200 [Hymenobacter sp.]
MKQIVNRLTYDTDTATLLADNRYWDGSNWERGGTNTYLYKTAKGRFFQYNTTQWQGQNNTITPLDQQEAMDLYESLREQRVEWAEAFDEEAEEA